MISFKLGPARFNYRVAAVCIRDGHVLAHKADHEDFWARPGGRVELMEPSAVALRRELREELDEEPSTVRLLWIVENLFTYEGIPSHEIGLYYRVAFAPGSPVCTRNGFRCLDALQLLLRWLLDTLGQAPIKPSFLADHLRALPDGIQHIVHRDAPRAP